MIGWDEEGKRGPALVQTMMRLLWTLLLPLGVAVATGCGSDDLRGKGGGMSGAGAAAGTAANNGGSAGLSHFGGQGGTSGDASGKSCTRAEDCGDTDLFICDPSTAKCASFACGPTSDCASGEVCLRQVREASVGACYRSCTPFTNECGADAECISVRFDDSEGACYRRGTNATACDESDRLSTSCAAEGTLCVDGSCTPLCSVFGDSAGCAGKTRCDLSGFCRETTGDAAKLDEPCATDAEVLTSCAEDATAWRGVCLPDLMSTGEAAKRCYQLCRLRATDCPGDLICQPITAELEGVGACAKGDPCNAGGAGTACVACVEDALTACCAAQSASCAAGSECEKLQTCLDACSETDDACIRACADASPDGVDPYLALASCLFGDQTTTNGACGLCQ